MKMFNFILLLAMIAGCTYISKTNVSITAQEASYPIGISSVKLKNGTINIHREMETKGIGK